MPRISTHVLDIARGEPAAGIPVELRGRALTTNSHGRTDEPLLSADNLEPGTYELTFRVGDYLRGQGRAEPFYDVIAIQFAIVDGTRNYHVPLLLAPHGYSTYLGS